MQAWLTGLLTGNAMSSAEYPKLEEFLGESRKSSELPDSTEEASANARAWGAALRGMNRVARRARKPNETLEDSDGGIDRPA